MDLVRNADWSLEEEKNFDEAIVDTNIEGPKCIEELIKRFPEQPVFQIRDQPMNSSLENLCTGNGGYDAKDLAAMSPSMCEESSRKKKKIEARGAIGKEPEESTREKSYKGQPWSLEEHELFLHGLQMYGRGKWRRICREFLKTRTPTQVASHAQKYFNRPKTPNNRRRASIHDIRLPNIYGHFTNSYRIPNGNHGIFTNSYTATSNINLGLFANSTYGTPNSNYGYFANNVACGSCSGPIGLSQIICAEPVVLFGGHQQHFDPSYQGSSIFKI